jgi:chromosome segregation ATPase
MLIALGLFLAGFAMFLLAPFYRRRAERLATDALRASMPMTEAEIRADKDRLRAEHAIAIHQLESKAEQTSLAAARQMVEINRRDALISALEGQSGEMRTSLDEHENARRVLEQTITDRLPRVEARLLQAKTQLDERDNEIATLTQAQHKYASALNEAHQINRQQREELSRMSSSVATRSNRNRDEGGNMAADSNVALRAEIEALRSKSRDQAGLIDRLQAAAQAAPASIFAHLGHASNDDRAPDDRDINRLKSSLSEAEMAMKAASGDSDSLSSELEMQRRNMAVLIENHETEVARLKAELAAAHDRISRQADKLSDELARSEAARVEVAAAIAEPQRKATLIERIAAPRAEVGVGAAMDSVESAPSSGFTRAMMTNSATVADTAVAGADAAPRVLRGGLIERLSGAAKPALPGE